tara:strand:+ start:63 stop:614 length:552 start_codon:yes stop_codon:yes gene_type:complete
MADYSKGIIYTIRSKDNIYVGSTLNFASRKNQHKGCIYNENGKYYNLKLYKTIRENNYEWVMRPYSKYPCKDKLELTIEEERIRQLLKADLNMCVCACGCSTRKEYDKQYYEKNKDKILERHIQYNEQRRDERKQYYDQHKAEISEKKKQKIICECSCVVAKSVLAKHRRTKKHIDLMEKLNQ